MDKKWCFGHLLALALLLSLSSAACIQPIAAPATPAPVAVGRVELKTETFTSPALADNLIGDPAERPLAILLPPSYGTSDQRYPVGSGGHCTLDFTPVLQFMAEHLVFAPSSEPEGAAAVEAVLPGSYTTVITPVDLPTGFGNTAIAPDDIALLTGTWQITFFADGRFTVTKDGTVMIEAGHYRVEDNRLTVGQETGPAACVGEPRLASGTYQWQRQGNALTLLVVNDKCGGRTVVFAAHPWWTKEPLADEPAAVFAAFNAAVNAHDVEGALSFFAAGAVAEFPNQPPPNVRRGTSELRAWLEADIAQNIHVETEGVRTDGDTLTATAKVAVDELRASGITLVGTAAITVTQGKITSFSYTLDEETLAKLQAAQPVPPVEFVRKIDTSAQQIKNPTGLAVDGEGNVYITDGSDTARVLKYDSQGNFVLAWGSRGSGEGQFEFIPANPDAGPTAGFVAVDVQGNVYVSDAYNFRVQKFDANGQFLMQFGSKGSGEGQFDEPAPGPIYVDSQGNIYVSTFPRVQKFDATGKFLAAYGKAGTGEGEFNGAAITTIDEQGNLYMADALNHRMQKLDSTGKFLLQWGSEGTGAGQFSWPVTAVLDSADKLYVADNSDHIQIFDTNGNFLGQWSETGAGNPPLSSVSGLAIDGQDNIYVADVASPSIYIFRPRTLAAAPAEESAIAAVPIPDLGESPLQISSATLYGQFNGIDYVKYTGHFVNTTDRGINERPYHEGKAASEAVPAGHPVASEAASSLSIGARLS